MQYIFTSNILLADMIVPLWQTLLSFFALLRLVIEVLVTPTSKVCCPVHKSWQLWENRGFDHSVVAQTCGHFIHLTCQKGYFDHRRVNPDDNDGFESMPLDLKQ